MSINFIPNDPLAVDFVPMRSKAPRPNRPASKAGLNFFDAAPEGRFDPGTPEFLFWQCREAALTAINVWEQLNGSLTNWSVEAADQKKLNLVQDGGDDLNAGYDRENLAFFHHTTAGQTTFSGASTDAVAHESGHAFLDTLRPELFGSNVTEHGAIHEAFGDCVALLAALFDKPTRQALLGESPNLGQANFVESLAEDLSAGVLRAKGPSHPASKPRHALNTFQFQLPTSLPSTGGPDVLTSEVHSFGRIFSGCFYDTIRNIFNGAQGAKNEAALLKAAKTAAKILIAGIKQAPLSVRFFQSVGRAMVLADDAANGGANRAAIGAAFAGHGLPLGSSALLLPRAALAGKPPKAGKTTAAVSAATLRDIRQRMGAVAGARLALRPLALGEERAVAVVHERAVPLAALHRQLKGVIAIAPEAVVVGRSGRMAAALSAIPDETTTRDEVMTFVETLIAHGRIDFSGKSAVDLRAVTKARRAHSAIAAATKTPRSKLANLPTHRVAVVDGKKTLVRVRFLCGCGCGSL